MSRVSIRTLLLGLALGCALVPHLAAAPPTLQDFFRNPEKTGFQVSPDGRHLSWVAPLPEPAECLRATLAGGPETRVTSETARDISGYFWKGNRILYVKDFGGDENFHVVSVDLSGKDLKDLTPGDKLRAEIVDVLEEDDQHLLLSHNRRDPQVFDVFRVDVKTAKETLVAQNPGNITGWVTDHAGHLRVATTTDGVSTSMLYRGKEGEPFKPILTTNFKESVSPLFFTFDNKRLYVSSNRGRDKAAIFEFDPTTAKEGKLIFEHPEVDVDGLVFSRKRKVLLAAPYTTWKQQRHFLDAEAKAMFEKVQAQFPGHEVFFGSANKAEDKYIVITTSDRTRGKRYLYEKGSSKLTLLAEVA
ncbi:MAG: S9 family peptidase, partial [Holophagaceae bacterium]|nr:S9 family peptidase [Holophagaceae bacterium]